MRVTPEEIQSLAELARLEIPENELHNFAKKFNDILEYVKILDKIDAAGVEPTAQIAYCGNTMREDIIKEPFTQQNILANAPEQKDGGYLVPRVMEGGGA